MLVITRRPNETIVIETEEEGKSIEIVVLGVRGRQVRIGVKAPREVIVHRQEVHQRQQAQESADLQELPLSASE